jgi:hypothetical protein
MKTTYENPIQPMEDQPAKPVHIEKQENHNCQQFYGPVTGCVFAMPGATVNQYQGAAPKAAPVPENATRNPQLSQKTILDYVMRLHPSHVRQEWQDKYQALWEEILGLSAVADKIYNPGRQQGTTFNRNLVANILHLMAEKKVLTFTASAKNMAIVLEGDADASVRAQLGVMPPKEMEHAIMELVKSPL